MTAIKYMCVIALGFVATGIVFAETTTLAYDSSPLAPGSRIVAGDLSKNEFFILGKEEHPPVTKIAMKQTRSHSSPLLVPKITTALNRAFDSVHNHKIQISATNTRKKINSVAMKKPEDTKPNNKLQLSGNLLSQKRASQAMHFISFQETHAKHPYHIVNKQVRTSATLSLNHTAKVKTQNFLTAQNKHKNVGPLTKHAYKFVSLTKHRHGLKIKTVMNHHPRTNKIAIAKL